MNDFANVPSTVRHVASFLNSPSYGNDGHLHWEWLQRGTGIRGISPTDLDAVVEVRNFFLMVESKDDGVAISTGQRLLIRSLINTGLVTFVYQWGKREP